LIHCRTDGATLGIARPPVDGDAHLPRFCEIRYCIVRHVGFLIGQGRPAGDADAGSETVEQVIEMLRRPLPDGTALTKVLERLECLSLSSGLCEASANRERV